MLIRPLVAGDKGPAVLALQLALKHSRGKHAKNRATGEYGVGTIKDVFAFEKAHKITPVSGRSCGLKTWAALGKTGNLKSPRIQKLLKLDARQQATKKKNTDRENIVRRIVAEAYYGLANSGRLQYRQVRPMAPSLHTALANNRTDCSAFVTLCYKAGKVNDPNGMSYSGWGYTGTLYNYGWWVTKAPEAGDLAFYGNMGNGIPSHVAVHISSSQVISFGGEPGPRKLPVRYRGDYRGSKRYF